MRLIRSLPAILVLSVVLAAPAPAAADDTIATPTRVTSVSAHGGRVVWSVLDPNLNTFVLMTRIGGVTSQVPVRPRTVPFDVDLGPDASGGETVAVYSRCRNDPPRREPSLGNAFTQLPGYAGAGGCDLYEFDFASGRERRLSAPSTPGASEFLPSVWKGRIAFARVYERKQGLAGQRAYLYVRSLAASGRSLRIPAGTRSTGRFCSGRPRRCVRLVEPGPTALDLAGRRLAFGWDAGAPEDATSAAYLATIGSKSARKTLLSRVGSGNVQGSEIESPTIASGHVYWTLALFGENNSNRLQRYRISTREHTETPLPPAAVQAQDAWLRGVFASAVDGPDVYYLISGFTIPGEPCTPQAPCSTAPGCSDAEPCQLRSTRDVAFRPVP